MKTEQVIEGNKLIAEFMGTQFYDPPITNRGSYYYIPTMKGIYAFSRIQFHNSWDWLIPVVEEIEGIGASVLIGRMFCEIQYQDPLSNKKHFNVRIASGIKINAVNGAVIEFIEWYNKNK